MTEEKKPGLQKLQDTLVELAKDMLMLDGLEILLEGLHMGIYDLPPNPGSPLPIRFASREKTEAFNKFVVAIKAARHASELFRKAHVEAEKAGIRSAMEAQLQERLAEIDREERERDKGGAT